MNTNECPKIYNPTVEECIAAGAVSIADIPDEELIRYIIQLPPKAIIPVRVRYENQLGHKCFHVEDLTSIIGDARDNDRYVILSVIRSGRWGAYPNIGGHFGLDEKSVIRSVADFRNDPKFRDTMFLFPTLDSYLLFDSKFEVSTYSAYEVLTQPQPPIRLDIDRVRREWKKLGLSTGESPE